MQGCDGDPVQAGPAGPSKSQPSKLPMLVLIDMRALTGSPVETTRTLDTVVIPLFGIDAVTITNGVDTVPAETTVETCPFASVTALCGTSDNPPTVVFSVKLTCVPCTA